MYSLEHIFDYINIIKAIHYFFLFKPIFVTLQKIQFYQEKLC